MDMLYLMMDQQTPLFQFERLEAKAALTSRVIHWLLLVSLLLFIPAVLLGGYGFAKAVVYIGALGWFFLEWFRGNLFERANSEYRKELERLHRRVENYEAKIRVEHTRFTKHT